MKASPVELARAVVYHFNSVVVTQVKTVLRNLFGGPTARKHAND